MINKLWTGVSLENYNNWYPLTGKITQTPQQYIKTWSNVNDWFKTFAIRAQNDINAYLDFILSKFPFDSFKDELIKETLRDMVYLMVEHWVFNRTPIEFNVDATIQFNNGSQFSASSIPSINVWDLAPSRMKILSKLTELKQVFLSYSEDELDVEKIDLKAFYTRNQVDELIEQQKEFTLSKQIKLYDDVVNDNEHEVFRGAVTKFVNKGYVATEYDKATETMILNWPNEIGTLPPEALQNNPQIGDFTHAPTADFSAKQQKRITANENNITKLTNELTKVNDNIDDIKNNWFNIATSPLWKKWSVIISSNEFNKWYVIEWEYEYQIPSTPMDNYIVSKITKCYLGGNVRQTTQKEIILDKLTLNDSVEIKLFFNKNEDEITITSNNTNFQTYISSVYQYQGTGIPIEFIAEESTGHDYYTKQETNELLDQKQNIDDNNLQAIVKQIVPAINENKLNIDKKQDKLTAGQNIKIENNVISATGGSGESLWEIDPNSSNIIQSKEKRIITSNNTRIMYIADPEQPQDAVNLRTLNKNIPDLNNYYKKEEENNIFETKDSHKEDISRLLTDMINIPISTEYAELKTKAKTIIDGINEILEKQPQPSPSKDNWKEVGTIAPNYSTVNYNFKGNKLYRLSFTWKAINIKKTVIQYLNFYVVTENVEFTILATMYQENNQDWRLCMSNDLIAVINRNSERLENCIFKLEELQE